MTTVVCRLGSLVAALFLAVAGSSAQADDSPAGLGALGVQQDSSASSTSGSNQDSSGLAAPPRQVDSIRFADPNALRPQTSPEGQRPTVSDQGRGRSDTSRTPPDPGGQRSDRTAPPSSDGARPTDFQLYAATSVGRILPVFGRSLFVDQPSTFAPISETAPSPDYIVGPGDELVIRCWGQLDVDAQVMVSREGTISVPRIGVVKVAGAKYEDVAAAIKAAVARYYRNFELSVSIGRLRSLQVFVMGHARQPGLYTLSSLSTLMNVLFAAGGPSETGSMRHVQLRRGGQLVGELDLYDVLLRGDKAGDQRLASGDVIFVPPLGPLAAIVGPVKTQGIFELRDGHTKMSELLAFAGGLNTTAATQSILLERLDQQRGRVLQELQWGDAALSLDLADGDIVRLKRVPNKFDNAITVRGSVIAPFRTVWRPGLKVSDVIPDRAALISNGYWARMAARAFEADPVRDNATEDVGQLRVRTALENLVDEVNWEYAVVERLDRDRIEPRLIPFNLAKAVLEHDPANDLALESGDVVTLFSRKDIVAPAARRTFFVRIEGEIGVPGVYQVKPGATLRELVKQVGGLTPNAYLFGAEFQRETVRQEQQERLTEMSARAEQDLERSAQERLARAVSPGEVEAVKGEIQAQRAALMRIKDLKATGRVVLELSPGAHNLNDLPDLVLEDGDRFFVPARYSNVGVYGAVHNQTSFIYHQGKTIGDYLALAGGPTRSADKDSIYVLRADGSVFSKRQTGWFGSFNGRELNPNDFIIVPEDYAPTSWIRELKDWSQIFYQFGLGAAAIAILGK